MKRFGYNFIHILLACLSISCIRTYAPPLLPPSDYTAKIDNPKPVMILGFKNMIYLRGAKDDKKITESDTLTMSVSEFINSFIRREFENRGFTIQTSTLGIGGEVYKLDYNAVRIKFYIIDQKRGQVLHAATYEGNTISSNTDLDVMPKNLHECINSFLSDTEVLNILGEGRTILTPRSSREDNPVKYVPFSGDKTTLAVWYFDGNNVSQADANIAYDLVRDELWKTQRFEVLERMQIDKITGEQAFQNSGCTTTECAVRIGKLLNVKKIVLGSFSRLGSSYLLVVRLVDVETGRLDLTDKVQVGTRIEDLPQQVKKLVSRIIKSFE